MRINDVVEAGNTAVSMMTKRPSRKARAIFRVSLLALAILLFWAGPALAAGEGADGAAGPEAVDEAVVDNTAGEPVEEVAAAASAAPDAETAAAEAEAAEAAEEPQVTQEVQEDQEPAAETAAAPADGETAGEEPASEGAGESAASTAGDFQALEEDCEELEAILELICLKGDGNVFWESKADYDAGLLSMRYRLRNTSGDTSANNLRVVSATANKGVKIHTTLPYSLGSLDPGDWLYFLLKWQVPKGVAQFVTDISICGDCEEFCADCPPPCEGDDCEPVCEGDDCEPVCEGDECEPVCEGDECEPECKGDECDPEPVCEGEGCNPPVDDGGERPVAQPVSPALTPLVASALPSTGVDATLPLALGLGLLMLGGLMPALRYARQRRR